MAAAEKKKKKCSIRLLELLSFLMERLLGVTCRCRCREGQQRG
jgi:hypothetical protein